MKLLKDLYEIYAPSNGEKKIKRFIKHWVRENVKDAIIRTDNNDGNVYIMRGEADTYPCVVAHLDQVQRNHSADFKAVETEDIIFGYSPSNRCKEGLGADDKNGIWVALKCLEEFDVIKVAFFIGEEIGCIGSSRCDMAWFTDCRFIVEPDRRGAHDLITDICGRICSKEFENVICGDMFGYAPEHGMMTDVLELSERGVGVSCINLSCGYYSPHSDEEYTVKKDLTNCLNFVRYIISTVTDVYPHKYEDDYKGYYSSFGYGYSSYAGSSTYKHYRNSSDNATKTNVGSDALSLISINDFADLESYVSQLVWQNYRYFTPEELWPYIESDLATYEIDKESFLELAEFYYEYYNEDYLCEYDDYDGRC